jgi:hypothetical protein
MELEVLLLERVGNWERLSRWERSELGRDLRRAGLSYGEIMDLIPVKKSTLATWCREVELTADQIGAIRARRAPQPGIPRNTNRKRRRIVELIKTQATLEAEHLIGDPIWVAGTVLYWGEGFTTQNRLGMANSDSHALRLFMRWCEAFHRPLTGFSAKVNLHADNDELAARRWWSAELGIPLADFHKSFVKPDGTGHRKNHLERGVCMVTKRKSADAFHITMVWIAFLQERLGR